jgi:hypothetical protein
LAGKTTSDDRNSSTPRATVEGGDVAPDRSRIQSTFFHARSQDCGGKSFPLNVTDGAKTFDSAAESKLKASIASKEGEAGFGR